MDCPYCPFQGPPRQLHAHLGNDHADAVRFERRGGRFFYAISCPLCGDGYEREIKPRGRDPGFVDEFSSQIVLVALDTLVNHLLGEHEDLDPGGADDRGASAGPPFPSPGTDLPGARPQAAPAGPDWLVAARRAAPDGPRPAREE